jgi:hypothetical protein
LLLVGVVIISACGGEKSVEEQIASSESCQELNDAGMALLQMALDSLADVPVEEVGFSETREEAAQGLADAYEANPSLLDNATKAELKRVALGCTEAEMDRLMCRDVDQLDPSGPAAFATLNLILPVMCPG